MITVKNSRIPALPPATLVVELILLADLQGKKPKYIRRGTRTNAQVMPFKRGVK